MKYFKAANTANGTCQAALEADMKCADLNTWIFMSSPIPVVSTVIAYILLLYIGPRIMRNRRPLKMNKLISIYNTLQVILAFTVCVKVYNLNLFTDGIMYAGCRFPAKSRHAKLLDLGWWYFISKFSELLDTIFFILRKKDKQLWEWHRLWVVWFCILAIFTKVTFLHVYHHIVMALYSWSYVKYASGGQGAILGFLNSFVHVIMYSYYFLSSLGPRFQKYLWWKKYVTTLQLIQFVLMLVYCVVTHFSPRCHYTPGFTYFICTNIIIFLCLFLKFYFKSYKRKLQKNSDKTE